MQKQYIITLVMLLLVSIPAQALSIPPEKELSLREKISNSITSFLDSIKQQIRSLFTHTTTQRIVTVGNTNVAACAVPLTSLHQSTINGIANNPRQVCLGGLITISGPPILGDAAGNAILDPNTKFGQDMQATVVQDTLICTVPCSNIYANEIQTCYDFSVGRTPFPIQAQTC